MLGRLAGIIAARLRRHPSDGVLFALLDGQLRGGRRARVRAHLERCRRCREKSAQIQMDWRSVTEAGFVQECRQAPAQDELLAGIRASIRARGPASAVQCRPQSASPLAQLEARRQMAAVLGVYLGKRAAAALLETGGHQPPGQECILRAGSALTALLGQKGAAAVEARLHLIMDDSQDSAARSSVL